MGKTFKKLRKTIGFGGKNPIGNSNSFVLESVWPNGTWYLEEVEDEETDKSVRKWLYGIYAYEQKLDFQQTHTQAYHPPENVIDLPIDWYPSAGAIRTCNNDPHAGDAWQSADLSYILARLQSLNHLKS